MNYQSKTAKLYQAGYSLSDAIQKGAEYDEFEQLERGFKGGSIPLHLLHGFKKTEPYSCEYHTGGKAGEQLRTIVKDLT